MALEIDNINLSGVFSATTISATTIVIGSQTLQQIFAPSTPGGYLPISGGTVTGETIFIAGLSANTLSGGTLYGDGSNLTGVGNAVGVNLSWKFSTTTSNADPGSGKFRYNNATPLNVSEIYVDYVTENGIDTKTLLNRIKSGAQIYIQQRDSSSQATLFSVTGDSVDNTGWFTIPVTAVSDAGGGVPQNNKGCIFISILQTPTGGTGTSTYVQPGTNITTGGTANNPTVNLVDSPSINNLSFSGTATGNAFSSTTISGGTLYSGSTNLYDIFSTGGPGGASTYVQPGTNTYTGGTASAPTVNVSALTINTLTASGASSFTTLSATTLISGSTNLYSIFATIPDQNDVTRVQPGTNITTGGTANNPTINLIDSPSVNNLTISGLTSSSDGGTFSTLSATTLFSGSTNVGTLFATPANITSINSQLTTKANLSGATFTGTVNAGVLSATTLSATTLFSGSTDVSTLFATPANITSINSQLTTKANLSGATFTGTINTGVLSATTLSATTTIFANVKIPTNPVNGYLFTSDASGNGTWQASPTGTGATKLDLQSVSNQATTPTATGALVDLSGMTLTTRNLGSSATTYFIAFAGDFSNNNNAGSSTFRIVLNGTQISGALTTLTNAGASLNAAIRTVSIACDVTGVTNGDIIKVQMSASTGTVTARNKNLTFIGILNANLV